MAKTYRTKGWKKRVYHYDPYTLCNNDIYFHIYADDTQLYVCFDLSNPNVALDRMNLCISDLRIWMIRNKLKINDSKTEFLIISSSFLEQNFDDLNIMVGDSNIV